MAADKYVKLDGGLLSEGQSLAATAGAGSDGRIVALDAGGRLDLDMMPVGVLPETITVPTSENLAVGNLVNLYSATGTLTARKADNSNGRDVDGFVLAITTSPNDAIVYLAGNITGLSGRTIGAVQWLGTAGALVEVGALPTGAGKRIQIVGKALSTTEVTFEPQDPVLLIA